MILDTLENAGFYSNISSQLKKGFDYLTQTDLQALEVGTHKIEGMDLFALVSEFETKSPEECRPEAHRKYADIQYIVSGKEAIGYVALGDQEITIPYFEERDIVFFNAATTPLVLKQGMFAVFFPQDIHQPGMQVNQPEKVKKVVVKVKL
jgi:YhcH/YjgK/YiaL family protein